MITNIVGKLQVESLIEADINTSLETYLSETKFFHGVFKTTLMMATFPFDVYVSWKYPAIATKFWVVSMLEVRSAIPCASRIDIQYFVTIFFDD